MSLDKRAATFRESIYRDLVNAIGESIAEKLEGFRTSDLFRSCVSCTHFDKANSFCKKYQAVPPVQVQLDGCDSYTDADEIPF